jgi:RNA polymerase sigma factor (sigma-70 family)
VAAVPSIGRATRVERRGAPGAAAAGDLYERYSAQIFGYCMHQLGSREEAEDAVQTTFMNAFRGLQRGVVPELESAWLFKIAHNVCLSRRRSSWRRGKVEAPNNFEVLQEIVPGREQIADELIRLQDVLGEMPENQRRAILLREWQGLSYREISVELGLSQAAVETLIFRARRALAQGLEQDADTWKKRLRRGADVGGVVACVKTLLSGGGAAAVKLGTTAAVVATAAVTAGSAPVAPQHAHAHNARAARTAARPPAVSTQPRRAFAAAQSSAAPSRAARASMHAAPSSARPHAAHFGPMGPVSSAAPPVVVVDPHDPTAIAPPPAPPAPEAVPQSVPVAPAVQPPTAETPPPPAATPPPSSESEQPPAPAEPPAEQLPPSPTESHETTLVKPAPERLSAPEKTKPVSPEPAPAPALERK